MMSPCGEAPVAVDDKRQQVRVAHGAAQRSWFCQQGDPIIALDLVDSRRDQDMAFIRCTSGEEGAGDEWVWEK